MTKFRPLTRLSLIMALVLAVLIIPCASAFAEPIGDAQETISTVSVPEGERALLEVLLQVKDLAARVHPSGVQIDTLYEGMFKGLMDSIGDPHSAYLTETELLGLTNTLGGGYSGVGIVLKQVAGELTIINTIKGSPAEKAGVEGGDIILSVDGTEYVEPGSVSDALRGSAGITVILTVRRPKTGEVLTFSLCREDIVPPGIEPRDLGDGLYYLDIDQFDMRIGRSIADEIAEIKANGALGLLLDLRDNPGGLLDAGVEVAEHLVPKGTIVELQGTGGRQVISGRVDTTPIPVVVLVNSRTASASEIVAGAIRDHGVGILVGERTYGKGSIQQVIDLGEGLGGIRITIAEYFTPSGTTISGIGLAPDILVSPDVAPRPTLEFKRNLGMGSVGLDVLAMQESLGFLGYYVGEPDGVFGLRTEGAIRRLLVDLDSTYSGSVGQTEIDILNLAAESKVSEVPDTVYLRGLEALRSKVQSGAWPADSQQ